jgi:hypothetical protein
MSDWGWQLYRRIPDQLVTGGVHFSRFLRNLTMRFPVHILRTHIDPGGTSLSVIVAGEMPWAEYLPWLLFPVKAQRTSLGRVPLWQLPQALRKWASSADLALVRVDRVSSRWLFGSDYLRVPELVDLVLRVPQDIDTLYRGNHNRNLRWNLRRAWRNQLTTQISHNEGDLADFYDRFHLPFVRQRFGRFAWPHNLPLLRSHFRQGGLVWALQNGQRLAGCVFCQRGTQLGLLANGTLDGDDRLTELGVQVALFHALIEHAQQLGCSSINLGGSRPLLTDGNLRFKRKWGTRLVQREISNHLLLHWERLDRSTCRALSGTAVLFLDQGQLSAVGTLDCEGPVTSADVSRADRVLRAPGLYKLYLFSYTGFEPELRTPEDTLLIDLKDAGSTNLPRALMLKPFGASTARALPPRAPGTAD